MPSCWKVACAGKHGGEGFNLSYEVLAYARPSTTPRRYRAGHSLLAGTNTPVPERPRFPAAPLSCHVFAARQRATYRGSGLSFETTRRNLKTKAQPTRGWVGCVYPCAYSIFSFLLQMDANEPKNTRLRGCLGNKILILNHKICIFCGFMRCHPGVFYD